MTFEMLKALAQAYSDQQKRPPLLPSKIQTMARAYDDICTGEDPWTALGNFTNAWYGYGKHMRSDLIKDPLTRSEQETEHTRHWGAFCAASVDYLCDLYHQPCPEWARDPYYILETPWWYTLHPENQAERAAVQTTAPAPFAHRNIFCTNRLFQNKYEMYAWIQEALALGLTNLSEIHAYARQKEISLHGA
jgi:hypothetical protein